MNTVDEIFLRYNTDKNQRFHNYSRQYEKLFSDFRDKPIRYLELGVFKGESLKAMRDVLGSAKCIVGVDIDSNSKQYENIDSNIFVEIGNTNDKDFIDKINQKYGPFDIVLDDGSHRNDDVIKSFEMLFPLLNDNGLYIVEDTITYKAVEYINKHYPNHLEYFFKYTMFLNQWRFDSSEGTKDHCIDPFKILKKTTNIFEYSIDRIEYGCSYIAISKKLRKHWV
jgi:hypothetical protein